MAKVSLVLAADKVVFSRREYSEGWVMNPDKTFTYRTDLKSGEKVKSSINGVPVILIGKGVDLATNQHFVEVRVDELQAKKLKKYML